MSNQPNDQPHHFCNNKFGKTDLSIADKIRNMFRKDDDATRRPIKESAAIMRKQHLIDELADRYARRTFWPMTHPSSLPNHR